MVYCRSKKILSLKERGNISAHASYSKKAAATMTMNSPESLHQLFDQVSGSKPHSERVLLAELVREIGLKCLGFNGVSITTRRHFYVA